MPHSTRSRYINDAPLVDRRPGDLSLSALAEAYLRCKAYVDSLAPDVARSEVLDAIVNQLTSQVQVLLAVASGIPEAFVIFETLYDRGADLNTADLLCGQLSGGFRVTVSDPR